MNKKLIVGCMIAFVIFGLLSYLFSGLQEEAKINWTQFLVQNNVDKEMISRHAWLTGKEKSVLNGKLGEMGVKINDELWKKFRYYDYWLSVCRSIAAVALLILAIKVLRFLLGKIYVSESFYRKFYLPPTEIEKEGEKREKGEAHLR
jgi:hypothetical protein